MIEHTRDPIPDWIVRAASWLELLVAVLLALAFLWVAAAVIFWLADRLWPDDPRP